MSENYSEACYTSNKSCAPNACSTEERKAATGRLAAVALGTALLLSAIGAFNLDRDVKLVTNSQVPYIEQRVDSMAPNVIAAARQNRGM